MKTPDLFLSLALLALLGIAIAVTSGKLGGPSDLEMRVRASEPVSLVLNHKNWTGLSLRELVDAGRIQAENLNVIRDFTKAALGEPKDMDEWHERREIAAMVVLALQGLSMMERSVA